MHRLSKLIVAGAISVGSIVAVPALVAAQAYPGGITEERTPGDTGDSGDVLSSSGDRPAQVQGVQATRGLAVTGGDVFGLTLLGGGLVAGGALIVRRSRRQLAATA